MSETVTFIHAADLHLGAPFRGLRALSPTWADRLVEAIPEAYDRLVAAAIDRACDFVVIAGDIFDAARPSYRDFSHFVRGLQKLADAGIPVYFCTGNHDPYTSWQASYAELPANVRMFPADAPGYFVYERGGFPLVLLGGRGYYSQSVAPGDDIADGITRAAAEAACVVRAPFAVGVLHTGLDVDPTKAPVDPAQLAAAGMDYWALGHIHEARLDDPADPRIAFSGCIQGRDINETGARGCLAVTLEEGRANRAEFVPLASVVWQKLAVDVSACATVADVHDAIMRALFAANGTAQCEEMVARVTLVGATPLHDLLADPKVISDVRDEVNEGYPVFFCDALIDRTRAPHDRAALRREGLFPQVLLDQADAAAADEAGAVAYVQDEFLKAGLQLPAHVIRDIASLQQQAADALLDELDGGRDER